MTWKPAFLSKCQEGDLVPQAMHWQIAPSRSIQTDYEHGRKKDFLHDEPCAQGHFKAHSPKFEAH